MLMGQRRSGKSSISGVVFQKMPPSETLYLETTTRPEESSAHSFMDFQIAELPGHVNYFTPDFNQANIFAEIGAVIWVIDAQDQYLDALNQLIDTITYLAQTWPAINVEVFVHKVDGLSEEYKNDTFRDIRQRILDELSDLGYDNAPVSFYQTSIYDHSVFESISKVIQKLLPQLPTLESLLNSLCSTCRIQKAYLFDIITKIYIASDTSPQDTNSYEICSDFIDVVVDIGELYGWSRPQQGEKTEFNNHACESMVTMEKKGQNYLYLREMNRYLALVCIMGDDNPMEKKVLIDYNVGVFQEALAKVFGW
ncbi:ras-related GTP-binding protein-like protein C [Aureobasidium pullulans]|nr:ras-related GTP-binding protein-like protein C [Aureobasidium pullulans]